VPQFDFSTLSIVLFSSLVSACVYYSFISLQLLPEVITTFKFRVKKLLKNESVGLISISLPNLFSYSTVVKKEKQ
jgi:hypothetical protein